MDFLFIPIRCRDSRLKHFCFSRFVPAVLIVLITHIILAVRWMLIKILSVVINSQRSHKVIVPGGCYLDINIIRKIDCKIKMVLRELQENTDTTQRGLHPYFIIIPDASADPVP